MFVSFETRVSRYTNNYNLSQTKKYHLHATSQLQDLGSGMEIPAAIKSTWKVSTMLEVIPMQTEVGELVEEMLGEVRQHFLEFAKTGNGTESWWTTLEDAAHAIARKRVVDFEDAQRVIIGLMDALPDLDTDEVDQFILGDSKGWTNYIRDLFAGCAQFLAELDPNLVALNAKRSFKNDVVNESRLEIDESTTYIAV